MPYPSPENYSSGPKKPQNDPKKQNIKKSENKKSYKKLFRPHLSPKNNPIEHKKAENETKKTKQKNQKSENKKNRNESYQFTLVNPKKLLRPHPDTKKYHDRALKGLIQTLWQPQIAKKGSKLPQKSKDSKRQKKNLTK